MIKKLLSSCLFMGLALPSAFSMTADDSPEVTALKNLKWRSIGPANMGGRVTDIVGIPGDPYTIYVAGADGGIFKSTNGGTTFKTLFQDQPVLSIGAMAIAPSDANVIWVGTGEGDPRNSTSFGNGIYRSTDAGETWTHLGLTDTERIKRIRVDPRDSDTAYVAALGHSWGPNTERGVFKTDDGGKTWKKVLYIDEDTGCSDLDLDPQNPRILYAGMYTFRRRPWRFDSGGGATALYRSGDGGNSWKKLTKGLPKGDMDRIGLSIARSQPSTVYMITESKTEGVLFRSDDRGKSWRKVHDDPNINFRPFYYSDIRVDPNNPERIFSLGGGLFLSKDGGKTFSRIGRGVHGDHQALWIDPMNSNRILSGSDGGFQVSYDGSKTFEVINNVAIAQFYHVNYDMRQPYYLCGGLQDNGGWCGPSNSLFREGIRKSDWYRVGGGDGFFAVPDLSSPNIVYSDSQGGSIRVTDTRSGHSRSIHPYPKEVGSSGNAVAGSKYRFNWNPPIVLSPHDPKTVYFGGNVVFKTHDYGHSWEVISPDLTTNDKSKQQSSGGPVVTDNTAAEFYCTILTIAESPVQPGVIWVGTDDGNIQVTRNGGKTWNNVVGNIEGLPPNSWVPTIEASHFDAGTAYVAVDRHRDNDFTPYAYKTSDYGETWTPLHGDLPKLGYVHVVREDPKNEKLLYAGTELGIHASWDGGKNWSSIRNNLPPVAVRDLHVHPRDNDLIIATHGRGIWILDNITPLQRIEKAMPADVYLFDIRPATRYQTWGRDSNLGQKTFAARNPPNGVMIDFYLEADAKDPQKISVADKNGKKIRTILVKKAKAGMNRAIWDFRYDGPWRAPVSNRSRAASRRRRFSFGGPSAIPGEYTISLRAGQEILKKKVSLSIDPRIRVSENELVEQLDLALRLRDLMSTLNRAVARTDDLTKQLTALSQKLKKGVHSSTTTTDDGQNGGSSESEIDGAQTGIKEALKELKGLRGRLVREGRFGYRYAPKLREEVGSLMRRVNGPMGRPTEPQKLRFSEVKAETEQVVADLNAVVSKQIKAINEKLRRQPHVVSGPTIK